MIDWHKTLGGGPPSGTIQITLFIASVDREGKTIEQVYWRDQSLAIFGKLFRGATAFPPGRGVWRDDQNNGTLIYDETILITSYIAPEILTQETTTELRRFLHRYGRESNQGEVGLIVEGSYIGITQFDQGEEDE
jgi:hypothetical protein